MSRLANILARTEDRLDARTGDDPGRTQRSAFSMAALWMLAAILGIAVGADDHLIAVAIICQSIWLAAEWVRREIIASEQRLLQREDDQ